MNDISVDVLIIGAGPSGCVAAAHLNNNNIKTKVVEKSKFPRFVIGERLLPRCMDHFEETGLLKALEARNYELKPGARFLKFFFSSRRRHTRLTCDWSSDVCSSDLGSDACRGGRASCDFSERP